MENIKKNHHSSFEFLNEFTLTAFESLWCVLSTYILVNRLTGRHIQENRQFSGTVLEYIMKMDHKFTIVQTGSNSINRRQFYIGYKYYVSPIMFQISIWCELLILSVRSRALHERFCCILPMEFSTSGFWKAGKILCEISLITSGKKYI